MLDKFAIAKVLREIAALLEVKEANFYKVRAYQQGANSIEMTDLDVEQLYREQKLDEIPGIGSALASIIDQLCRTGSSTLLEELKEEVPSLASELVGIPGLNIKRLKILQEDLGITTREELLKACENGSLSSVRGLGKTFEKKLLRDLNVNEGGQKTILVKALKLSERLAKYMAPQAIAVEIAGEIRRWQEVINNIDIVVSTDDIAKTKKHFEQFSSFAKCDWLNDLTGVGHLSNKLTITLTIARPEEFVIKLHEKTGSASHLHKLEKIAQNKDIPLYENSAKLVIKKDRLTNTKATDEEAIYSRLGLPYITPELREDWGEIEEAQSGDNFHDLVKEEDIKGMVHCHTDFSDGNTSIEGMARAAEEMGYSYITITDHSPTAFYANGLDVDRLKEQWEQIEITQEKVKIKILRGTESDILADGALDYPDHILEKFDIIIASIHARYKMDENQMTNRIKTCMQLPIYKIWGHALGRLVLKRDPVPCRIEEVLDLVAASQAAIEINGDPHRMDLEPFWLREARKLGIKFVISTDAHAPSDLYNLPFGVHMARKAGIRRNEILNTLSYTDFRKAVKPVKAV